MNVVRGVVVVGQRVGPEGSRHSFTIFIQEARGEKGSSSTKRATFSFDPRMVSDVT